MDGLAMASLVVSIFAALIALAAIFQAICFRNKTKKETQDQFNFTANLVMYATGNPEKVTSILQSFQKSGAWGPVEVIRQPDGKLNFKFNQVLSGIIGISEKVVVARGNLETETILPKDKSTE